MSATERPAEQGSVIDLTDDGPILQPPETEQRIRYSFAHLLDAFAALTAIRDGTGQIVDFRVDYANDAARVETGTDAEGDLELGPSSTLVQRHTRELFDEFCHVVETGEPLTTQSLEHEDTRLVRALDVRAERIGDGLAAVWRDVTAHVLMKLELEQLIRSWLSSARWWSTSRPSNRRTKYSRLPRASVPACSARCPAGSFCRTNLGTTWKQ